VLLGEIVQQSETTHSHLIDSCQSSVESSRQGLRDDVVTSRCGGVWVQSESTGQVPGAVAREPPSGRGGAQFEPPLGSHWIHSIQCHARVPVYRPW